MTQQSQGALVALTIVMVAGIATLLASTGSALVVAIEAVVVAACALGIVLVLRRERRNR